MKTIALTFDYEVFLGVSGSIEKCILEPVNKLILLLEEERIPSVFFVDVLFLEKLLKNECSREFTLIKLNLQELLKKGHSLELHIHPHWLDAKRISNCNEWDLTDDRRYRVSSLTKNERIDIFTKGYDILLSICKEIIPDYKITAFRAGGLCIQPFDIFDSLLTSLGINIDSSVAPGLSNDSPTHQYDFTNIKSTEPYFFTEELNKPLNDGEFLEFPILAYKVSFFERLLQKLKRESPGHTIFGDGKANGPKSKVKQRWWDRFKSSKYLFSLDGDYYEDVFLKKIYSSKADFITILSHPKLLSEESFKTIKKLSKSKKIIFSDLNSKYNQLKSE